MRWFPLLSALALGACQARSPQTVEDLVRASSDHNVVIVLLDAAAAAHFSFLGYPQETAPNLHRLAGESIVFEQAYAQASATPLSVLSLFTSRYPWPENTPEIMGEIGPILPEQVPAMHRMMKARFAQRLGVSASNWISHRFGYGDGFTHFVEVFGDADEPIGPDSARRVSGAATEWIREHARDPFFAYLHYYQPHAPYTPPEPYDTLFDPAVRGHSDGSSEALKPFRRTVPDELTRRNVVALYDGNIAYVDAQLQQVVEALQSEGVWDRTIFVLLSDHGEAFWEHGTRGHGLAAYEEYIRVPLLVRIPSLAQRPLRVRTPVQLMDILPTLLELLGLPDPPAGLSGRSLAQLILAGDLGDHPPTILSRNHELKDLQLAIRMGNYKLIQGVAPERFELFDLASDPREQTNLFEGQARGTPLWQTASNLAIELSKHIEAAKRGWGDSLAAPDSLDQDEIDRLKAMGYLN